MDCSPDLIKFRMELEYHRQKAEDLWRVLVMLKRELDAHDTKPGFLELPSSAWEEAVARCAPYQPKPPGA